MQKNEIYRLSAEKLGAEMEGVCRLNGMPVFVPGLLPGEETDVRIVKAEKRYAFGRMESLPAVPSPDRKDPGCPVYPRCGGCTCRHMRYATTLEGKRQQVIDCFRRIGGLSPDVAPVIGMEHPDAYRNKTSLPCGGTADAPVLGFYAPRSHTVIPAAACPNAMSPANAIAETFLSWMRQYRIEPYREETHSGLIRHLVIRINREGESMVTVVVNHRSLPHAEELADTLRPLNTVSLWWNENRDRTNVILSPFFHLIYGKETLPDRLCGLRFELSPASFFQVNPVQTERLYNTALDFAELQGGEYAAWVSTRYLSKTDPRQKTASNTSAASSTSSASTDAAKILSDMNAEFKTGKLVTSFTVYARPSRASGWVNLRWAPSTETERIATCPQGKALTVIGETKNWYQVQDPETGMIGFIMKKFVSAN